MVSCHFRHFKSVGNIGKLHWHLQHWEIITNREKAFSEFAIFYKRALKCERATLEEKDDRNGGDYMYRRKEYLGPEL